MKSHKRQFLLQAFSGELRTETPVGVPLTATGQSPDEGGAREWPWAVAVRNSTFFALEKIQC